MRINNLIFSVICLLATPVLSPVIKSITMSELNLDSMRQLLAPLLENQQSLLKELKSQVKVEVAEQLVPHTAKLDQLNDDHLLLKKQVNELSGKLQQIPPSPKPTPIIPAPSSIMQMHTDPVPTHTQVTPTINTADLREIEAARRTLVFSPITNDDLERLKLNQAEKVSTEDLLKRAIQEYLEVYMNIPTSIIARMEIKKISHNEEIEFSEARVEFSNMCPVNTVFKYVRNLPSGHKVSIFVPPILEGKYSDLLYGSYYLRNGSPKHKCVIKYLGNDLVLSAKTLDNNSRWSLVTDPTQHAKPPKKDTLKRPRDVEADSDTCDENKKAKNDAAENTNNSDSGHDKTPDNHNLTTTGIPKPKFHTVPCYKPLPAPSLLHTPGGGFWNADDPRSPNPLRSNPNSGNSNVQTTD